jgi:hypothetical protein
MLEASQGLRSLGLEAARIRVLLAQVGPALGPEASTTDLVRAALRASVEGKISRVEPSRDAEYPRGHSTLLSAA